jgi:hypothetical protein
LIFRSVPRQRQGPRKRSRPSRPFPSSGCRSGTTGDRAESVKHLMAKFGFDDPRARVSGTASSCKQDFPRDYSEALGAGCNYVHLPALAFLRVSRNCAAPLPPSGKDRATPSAANSPLIPLLGNPSGQVNNYRCQHPSPRAAKTSVRSMRAVAGKGDRTERRRRRQPIAAACRETSPQGKLQLC